MEIVNGIITKIEESDIHNGSFILPNGVVEIGNDVGTSLESLTKLPNGIKIIGNGAFRGCTSLVTLPDSITIVGDFAFGACTSLKKLPNSITTVGEQAFFCCSSLETLPNSITTVGESAFFWCSSLKTLPNSITTVGECAFFGCSSLETLPDSITTVGVGAFGRCTSLKTLPNSITTVGEQAFSVCTSLETISNSITTVGYRAFSYCILLKKLPNSITTVEDYAFSGCSSLETINLSDDIKTIGKNSFDNCPNLKTLITSFGTVELHNSSTKDIIISYLYMYINSLLADQYSNQKEFMNNSYFSNILSSYIIYKENSIIKFKNLLYKMRRDFDIPLKLFKILSVEECENFHYNTWDQIKDLFYYLDDLNMSDVFGIMIGVFGLFDKDTNTQERLNDFKNFFQNTRNINDYTYSNLSLMYPYIKNSFKKVEVSYYILKKTAEIPQEFSIYLDSKLSEKRLEKIKKLSGNFGKRMNDFVEANYKTTHKKEYKLKENAGSDVSLLLFNKDIQGLVTRNSLHRMFDGCEKNYNPKFYDFFMENLEEILLDEEIQRNIKEIKNRFSNIQEYYMEESGSSEITLKQAINFIENVPFTYHPGNLELAKDVKNAGVVSQEAFDYHQDAYEENKAEKNSSLVKKIR